ncbi:putative Endonuclease/Exonuclease/phosphatase fa [Sulfitobacter noctilucicola]|uniref:Endonuclease/exonuclease/phosphatase family metal-dependent hydrolase n=1 Tax=Sulfitobacter noctilucicola TaxID=1342301 RepID=A0A7W6M8R3_9RHOB|nr:endonuclease/exonuclease/phosphatase family protein [Sulfitobacter noctilucicola]KIN64359.1 putative Endonuclease/Exonuclease/phosphatase fa [Sulfitobacter noctilucicola]MBB4174480.1 endonuclease/exonuclease/phosphatase family metal-dependent hydrolase [Sulfitobacter noctilucicola]
MRIATYNVEWFNSLFDDAGTLLDDAGWSARYNVTRARQIAALGVVFQALDADAIMIIEAPDQNKNRSTIAALTSFAEQFGLRAREALIGFANETQQEIALLYDPEKLTVHHAPQGKTSGPAGAHNAPRFDGALLIDLDIDATEDLVVFSKPPLEVAVQTAGGFVFHMIGVHLKSKAPHGARSQAEVLSINVANRRKQLAQAIWLRGRIEAHQAEGTPLMVMGDMNDGPGLDEFESLFGRSSVEIIMGDGKGAPLYDPHARQALSRKLGATPTTARFWIRPEKRFLQALLDYIMVTDELRERDAIWRIWHPMDDPECWNNPELRDALVTASDHFPVTIDFDDRS